jgi:hypothetical protein
MNKDNEPLLTPRERAILGQYPEVEITFESESDDDSNHSDDPPTSDGEQPSGLGGWLTVMIVLFVLGALSRLSRTNTDIFQAEKANPDFAATAEWDSMLTQVYVVSALDIILSFIAIYCLIKVRKKIAVTIVVACLWLLGPIKTSVVYSIVGYQGDITGALMLSMAIPAIWTAYLVKSRRVRNTYTESSAQ